VISDLADGHIARKTKTTTNIGAALDSAADLVWVTTMLIIVLPILWFDLQLWMMYWVVLVIFIRILALVIGFVRFRTLTLLHTWANKYSGLGLVAFPYLYMLHLDTAVIIAASGATIAAVEELLITIRAQKLERDIKSIFHINKDEEPQ
jgi:CDP-diacylglycerol--glycerol-3-phosphate 3-phosphatidyltransferase